MAHGMIYFIREAGFGLIKIGYSADPAQRMKILQIGQPYEFSLVATVPGSFYEERGYHIQFAEHRFRGEWFYPRGELATLDECVPVLRVIVGPTPSPREQLRTARELAWKIKGDNCDVTKRGLTELGFWPPAPSVPTEYRDTVWISDNRDRAA